MFNDNIEGCKLLCFLLIFLLNIFCAERKKRQSPARREPAPSLTVS